MSGMEPRRHSGASVERLSPEPRTDGLDQNAIDFHSFFRQGHRFWVPGSALRAAPE